MRKILWGILAIAMFGTVGGSFMALQAKSEAQVITIAEQYGLAYAPLQIMKQRKILEKNFPGLTVRWRQLANTTVIREAMLAGEVDAGFMAIPPFLIGWDKDTQWKIACGLSESPVGLVTNRPGIRSLKDFTVNDRIALPQPGSVQHILLAMACEHQLGDAKKLDNILVTLAHPDGMNALMAGKEITAHFTAPPYLFDELALPGMRQILDGKEAMGGDFTFIVGATTADFHNRHPRAYRAFVASVREAVRFINQNPKQAAALLAPEYQIPETDLVKYLTWPGVKYTTAIRGVDGFAGFMLRNGYISKKPKRNEIIW